MKKLILSLSVALLVCSCQTRSDDQNPPRNTEDNRQQRRPGCGSCESEKPQAPAAVAPQQAQTVATPEVKVEKAQ